MTLRFGTARPDKYYFGSTEVDKIYYGETEVYSAAPSGPVAGTLYMVSAGTDALFTVNRTTGTATRIGSANQFGVGESFPSGMAWDGTNLYMVGFTNDYLSILDRTTGIATRVGTSPGFGVGETSAQGIAWDGTNLYMTCLLYTSPSPRDS